jgi:glycosyltransferase involved in cell wall biosynthesis
MTSPREPTVTVGLAVRNEPQAVRRCIESVLGQGFGDFELVVSDNASDDGTVERLQEYARQDRRVRLVLSAVNVGIHENMNRALGAARGTLYRWISADDWLEPDALSTAVQALEDHPEAVGVTTGFTIHTPGVAPRYEQYAGEFPTSPDAARRFERMLWFFHAGDAKYDPVYGVYRREQLMRTGRLRANERTDWLLSAELALMAPIIHVDELLANRTRTYPVGVDRAAFRRRLDPEQGERLKAPATRLARELGELARSAELTEPQLRRCRRAVRSFWARELVRTNRMRLSDLVRPLLSTSAGAPNSRRADTPARSVR